ncbi:membrane protein insertase YidC [Priestia endophytica]|uniref:membrane protein insertase YidC n=1 Tax=Priestia endophytica TaxID=135735 RepID=UPI00124F3197|nr:membrane protein insertase YidC [Priestia endophytica]KAB2488209.1 membrane protein insertase YidC [Priestia endophytica]
MYIINQLSKFIDILANSLDSYGLAIISITLISRAIFFPLSFMQSKNSKITKQIKPLLKDIDKDYNSKNMSKEQIIERRYRRRELLEKYKVRPITLGCLPFLLQIPVFIMFYKAISINEHIYEHKFLWFKLGEHDPLFITSLIVFISCFAQSNVQNPNMFKFNLLIALFITVIISFVPSAVAVYLTTINIYSIIQFISISFFLNKSHKMLPLAN